MAQNRGEDPGCDDDHEQEEEEADSDFFTHTHTRTHPCCRCGSAFFFAEFQTVVCKFISHVEHYAAPRFKCTARLRQTCTHIKRPRSSLDLEVKLVQKIIQIAQSGFLVAFLHLLLRWWFLPLLRWQKRNFDWWEKQNRLVLVGPNGCTGPLLQSSSYTALFLVIELFTPLFDAGVFPHRVWEPLVMAEVEAVKKCFFILSFSLFFHFFVDLFDRSVGSVESFSGSSCWINVKMPASQCSEDWKVWISWHGALEKRKKESKNKSQHAGFSQNEKATNFLPPLILLYIC